MRVLILALVTILSLTGSACTQVRYVTLPLARPVGPLLPTVADAELECLSDDAYRRLVRRDVLRRQYAEELEAVIDATREVAD